MLLKDLKSYLGVTVFLYRFIPIYRVKAEPLKNKKKILLIGYYEKRYINNKNR